MKNIYRLLSALASAPSKFSILALLLCTLLPGCGLDELHPSASTPGAIEFVARTLGYNNQTVDTKSTANEFENEIKNCFFLLFDNDPESDTYGDRLNTPVNLITNGQSTLPTVRLDKLTTTSVTACFIANVPSDFVSNITGLTPPDENANKQNYLNTAVLTGITYGTGTDFGKPLIDLDGASGSNSSVACIPMFGKTEISPIPSTSQAFSVPLKRLFAKVTVNLTLNVNLDSWVGGSVGRLSYLQLYDYQVNNVPTKVKLVESPNETESSWVRETGTTSTSGPLSNTKVYNGNSLPSFQFYIPEYYLTELTEVDYYNLPNRPEGSYGNQRYKPLCFDEQKKPVYLFINGSFSQYSYNTTNLQYKVYLGRDEHSDYCLARNVNYINTLTINNFSQHDDPENDLSNLDHRVTTEVLNNPVAQAGESANCYIIGQATDYSFPAYKGAYKNLTQAVLCNNPNAKLVELANDNDRNIILDNLNYDVDNNIVSFKVTSIANGNVVIGLLDDKGTEKTDDDEIEWSWHLWCNTQSRIQGIFNWGTFDNHTYPDNKLWMDRNLGATSSTGINNEGLGLYYQYGSKNPFISDGYKGGGTNGNRTWNPENEETLTDCTKAINDPCPPGYKVPQIDDWSSSTSLLHTTLDIAGWFSNGILRIYNSSNSDKIVYYPYSGIDCSLNGEVAIKTDTCHINKTFYENEHKGLGTFVINVPKWAQNLVGTDKIGTYDCRVRNVKIELIGEGPVGCLLTANENIVQHYGHASLNIDINNLSALRNKLKIKSLVYNKNSPDYEFKWSRPYVFITDNYGPDITLEDIDPFSNDDHLKSSDKLNLIMTLLGSGAYQQDYLKPKNLNSSNGNQVRCVQDSGTK